jgi:hypothetical protein
MRIEDVYFEELIAVKKSGKKEKGTVRRSFIKIRSHGFELISSILNRMRT